MENLYIYLRVSSDSQITDGFGIENQSELGLKVSERLGMNPIIFNEGSSSSHSDSIEHRPKLKELLLKIEDGDVKSLWVYQMDRLSRNDVVSFRIRQILKKNGVKLYVGSQNEYDLDNPNDKLMFTIMEGFSEFDNSVRTERLRRGKLSKIKKGGWMGGPPPYGYQLSKSQLVIDKLESSWVKRIYEEFGKGSSIYSIRKLLMTNGVVSRRGNVVWSDQSIRKILENTHYSGYYFYTDQKLKETVRCEVPSFLPSKLVKEVRERLRSLKPTSNYVKTVTLLKELLVCGHCGSKFGQRINKSQYYNHYYCRGNEDHKSKGPNSNHKICTTDSVEKGRVRSINIDDTDRLIWERIIEVIENSHIFKELFKTEVMTSSKTHKVSVNDRKRMLNRIKLLERKVTELNEVRNSQTVEGLLEGMDPDQFKSLSEKFDEKKRQYDIEIEDLKDQIYDSNQTSQWVDWVNQYKDKISNLRNTDMTIEEKKSFLNGVIDHIVVTTIDKQSHNLEIHFKSPYVKDTFEWNYKGSKKDGYRIGDGRRDLLLTLDSKNKRLKKSSV